MRVGTQKKLIWFFAWTFFVLFAYGVVMEGLSAIWRSLFFSAGLTGFLMGLFFFLLGIGVRFSNHLLNQGVEFSMRKQYPQARQSILAATRMNGDLLDRVDVKALYEIVVAQDGSDQAMAEIKRVRETIPGWQLTRLHRFYYSDSYLIIFVGVIVLCFLMRLAALF